MMTRDEIRSAKAFRRFADTTHETAQDWYDSYGWHLSTEDGDVVLQAVDYDWLDEDDAAVSARLREDGLDDLSGDEIASLIEHARTIRDAAQEIESLLEDAVSAYDAGDLDACRRALLDAESIESDHGDSPASSSLAAALLDTGPHAGWTTIRLFGGGLGLEELYVRCNLAEAGCPVEVDYCNDTPGMYEGTQYECADARHTDDGLAVIGISLAAIAVGMSEDEFRCEWEVC